MSVTDTTELKDLSTDQAGMAQLLAGDASTFSGEERYDDVDQATSSTAWSCDVPGRAAGLGGRRGT